VTARLQVLSTPGCGNAATTVALVREVAARLAPGALVEEVLVETLADAERLGFPGSPTVRLEGRDIDPDPPRGVGLG